MRSKCESCVTSCPDQRIVHTVRIANFHTLNRIIGKEIQLVLITAEQKLFAYKTIHLRSSANQRLNDARKMSQVFLFISWRAVLRKEPQSSSSQLIKKSYIEQGSAT